MRGLFLRFEAVLNGQKFSQIAPELTLLDIVENEANVTMDTVRRGYGAGSMVLNRQRESLSVTLTYVIRAYDISRRSAIRDKIAAWASKGGVLTINSRKGKTLTVEMDKAPALDSNLKWTQAMSLTLTAYASPYWESASHVDVDANTLDAETGMYYMVNVADVSGNAGDCPVTYLLRNAGNDALRRLQVQCGKTMIELTGLDVPAGYAVALNYGQDGILRIIDYHAAANGEDDSLLANRTPQSSDDLMMESGSQNTVKVIANVPVSGLLSVHERWL